MEDILDLYAEPYQADYPVVCFDEFPYQLVSETQKPLPLQRLPQAKHLITKQNPPVLRLDLQRSVGNLNCFVSSGEPISVRRVGTKSFRVVSQKPLKPPREHYTCTAKSDDGRWYWYSYFWVFPR